VSPSKSKRRTLTECVGLGLLAVQSTGIFVLPLVAADSAPPPAQHSVHLYYTRTATDLATALSPGFPGLNLKALGNDTLVFSTNKPEDEATIAQLLRWIAVLDSPKPEVSLNVWSVQLSSHDPNGLTVPASAVGRAVSHFNQGLQDALEGGWKNLVARRASADPLTFFAPTFSSYIDENFPSPAGQPKLSLKFGRAFNPLQPNLTHMLGFIAAVRDPGALASCFVNGMEGKPCAPALAVVPGGDCEQADSSGAAGRPFFNCLRAQLAASL